MNFNYNTFILLIFLLAAFTLVSAQESPGTNPEAVTMFHYSGL